MSILRLKNSLLDEVDSFLSKYSTSMLMKVNLRKVGLESNGVHSGMYYGYFDSCGALQGIVALYWNGILMSQCPQESHLFEIIESIRSTSFALNGIFGPSLEVNAVKRALNISPNEFSMDSIESLFELNISDMKRPCRISSSMKIEPVINVDKSLIITWIRNYSIEALRSVENDMLHKSVIEKVDGLYESSHCYVLIMDGEPVSLCGFNTVLSDIIQIGPVWTPIEFRGKGYAQSLVYLNILRIHNQDLKKGILFTDSSNLSAIRCYEGLGFVHVGHYHICFTKVPILL